MTRGFVTCRLKAIVRKHGLTLKALAGEVGLVPANLSEISAGRRQPTTYWTLEILDGLERLTGRKYDVREVWAPVRALAVVRKAA